MKGELGLDERKDYAAQNTNDDNYKLLPEKCGHIYKKVGYVPVVDAFCDPIGSNSQGICNYDVY